VKQLWTRSGRLERKDSSHLKSENRFVHMRHPNVSGNREGGQELRRKKPTSRKKGLTTGKKRNLCGASVAKFKTPGGILKESNEKADATRLSEGKVSAGLEKTEKKADWGGHLIPGEGVWGSTPKRSLSGQENRICCERGGGSPEIIATGKGEIEKTYCLHQADDSGRKKNTSNNPKEDSLARSLYAV